MTQEEPAPKLHVDTDWKAEAQKEKERLAADEAKKAEDQPTSGGGRELPQASFSSLVGLLASQALMGLGTMVDRQSQGLIIDQEGSRFAIDLLGVLEEKTRGNLGKEEETELRQVLAELRARYVEVARLVAEQVEKGALKPKGSEHTAPVSPGSP